MSRQTDRRAAQVAKRRTMDIPQVYPPNQSAQFARGALGGLICILLGTMINVIPFWTSAWIMAALLAAYALAHGWPYIAGKSRVISCVIAAAFIVFCGVMGRRAYVGANYHLKYRVCGAPLLVGDKLDAVYFGIEWVNENREDLYIKPDTHSLSAGDRHSTLKITQDTVSIHPSGQSFDDAKTTDRIDYVPQIAPPRILDGNVRYTFKFGTKADELNQTIVVDGSFDIPFIRGGEGSTFRFSPSKESSFGYIGTCDIEDQIYGQQTAVRPPA